MDPEMQLVKSDVTLVAILVPVCDECERPATTDVVVDFRSAGLAKTFGSYCLDCARIFAERIRDGLPV